MKLNNKSKNASCDSNDENSIIIPKGISSNKNSQRLNSRTTKNSADVDISIDLDEPMSKSNVDMKKGLELGKKYSDRLMQFHSNTYDSNFSLQEDDFDESDILNSPANNINKEKNQIITRNSNKAFSLKTDMKSGEEKPPKVSFEAFNKSFEKSDRGCHSQASQSPERRVHKKSSLKHSNSNKSRESSSGKQRNGSKKKFNNNNAYSLISPDKLRRKSLLLSENCENILEDKPDIRLRLIKQPSLEIIEEKKKKRSNKRQHQFLESEQFNPPVSVNNNIVVNSSINEKRAPNQKETKQSFPSSKNKSSKSKQEKKKEGHMKQASFNTPQKINNSMNEEERAKVKIPFNRRNSMFQGSKPSNKLKDIVKKSNLNNESINHLDSDRSSAEKNQKNTFSVINDIPDDQTNADYYTTLVSYVTEYSEVNTQKVPKSKKSKSKKLENYNSLDSNVYSQILGEVEEERHNLRENPGSPTVILGDEGVSKRKGTKSNKETTGLKKMLKDGKGKKDNKINDKSNPELNITTDIYLLSNQSLMKEPKRSKGKEGREELPLEKTEVRKPKTTKNISTFHKQQTTEKSISRLKSTKNPDKGEEMMNYNEPVPSNRDIIKNDKECLVNYPNSPNLLKIKSGKTSKKGSKRGDKTKTPQRPVEKNSIEKLNFSKNKKSSDLEKKRNSLGDPEEKDKLKGKRSNKQSTKDTDSKTKNKNKGFMLKSKDTDPRIQTNNLTDSINEPRQIKRRGSAIEYSNTLLTFINIGKSGEHSSPVNVSDHIIFSSGSDSSKSSITVSSNE
eukprot:CAMPEP_0170539240 /NCGR_PEP_ID=MMETSP0209-20121228/103800_1 /TAXON_ID=665100 ORGANISM="Litonotus pictus, Strain P1" /NCGR_SAMPLE_ID=MMETSP0209 /ASSEMBLY_ACC=CAM_ASM_000301 /LENGTH=787 /DNA_ID=CAMNT_0010841111 /DNA_START=1411 /DNA_END=3772 /DNA_ORIENTATION=-